jgi:hypothetical protein
MRWGYLIGAVCLAAAALGVWMAFQNPTFVAGLTAIAAGAVWKAVAPKIAQPEPDDVRKARQLCERQGRRWNHARRRCE